MKTPAELSRQELEAIVSDLQAFLFEDLDFEDKPIWNPEKEVSGSDLVEFVLASLRTFEAAPKGEEARVE